MKKLYLFYALGLPLLFASCSVYQLNTISSNTAKWNEKDGSFVQENDSLRIIYSFAGQNAPVSIEIHNKLNEPITVDWQRSALVYNDSAISYAGNKAYIKGDISGSSINWTRDFSSNRASLDGSVTLPQYVDFIPPKSFIRRVPLELTNAFFENFADTFYRKIKVPSVETDYKINGKRALFTASNSPLVFSSYLTLTYNNKEDNKIAYQQQFYISELLRLGAHPSNTTLMDKKRGDMFYVSQQTGYGKTMTTGAVVAIGAAAVAGSALTNTHNNGNIN